MTLPFSGLVLPTKLPYVLLAADMGMGASYSGTQAGSQTSVTLTVKSDGTWTITFGAGDTPAGSPTSGNWTASTSAGIGLEYQVKFIKSNEVNSPAGANDASDWTTITGDLTVTVSKGAANASADVTAQFRPIYGSQSTLADTSNFAANGA